MGPTRLSSPTSAPERASRDVRTHLGKVEVVANLASGSVSPNAPAELAQVFADFGVTANIVTPQPNEIRESLQAAIDRSPDLLVVLAGDGTARCAAELVGPDGPLLAPLAGGTMNMLPHAVYGARPWAEALHDLLHEGEAHPLAGGHVERHRFLVAAILGSPALWAPAREAARDGKIGLALDRAGQAWRRAFTGRLRYSLDGGPREKAEALVLMCPLASKVMDDDAGALEAAALNIHGAGEALRLGLNAIVRDWRVDPSVDNRPTRLARVWSAQEIPALLDGEMVKLSRLTEIRYEPCVCRVLALPKEER